MKLKHVQLTFKATSIDEKNYTIEGVFSTNAIDRHNEIVDQDSWILTEFMANPVILYSHDYYNPAIAKALSLSVKDMGNGLKGLVGTIKFAVAEYEFAKTIFNLYKGGFMSAFSAGFGSGEQEMREDGVVVLKQNTLYEISCVNVPANALSLAKAKGIDVSALEEYQKAGRVLSKKNRQVLENAHKAIKDVLDADSKEGDNGEEENNKSNKSEEDRIATHRPKQKDSRVGERKKAINVLNKAIRALYREQRG